MYDAVIIGAGVSGAAIARELSRYDCRICVLEKEADVCSGTSKANSGIVHAGHDARNGSLKAQLNVRGNALMEQLSKDLDFPFIRNGSLVVATQEKDIPKLQELLENGQRNQVPGLELLSASQVREMEPHISDNVVSALYAPTGGIVCPFGLNIALAENAYANGVEFYFNTKVTGICKAKLSGSGYEITALMNTGDEEAEVRYETRLVINAAGVFADEIHNMAAEKPMEIISRKGEYFLLDASVGGYVSHTIFDVPGKYGKGVLVTPTVHGNLLVGPTAEDLEDKEATSTTAEGLEKVRSMCARTVDQVPLNKVITSFAGLRANESSHDFVIEEVQDGFIDCAGIASPGLSSSPAIGEMVAQMAAEKYGFQKKQNFIEKRKGILNPKELTLEERNALIKEHPEYGTIICRCEMITQGEIQDAIRRPLGATTMDGVKRRVRAQMGRCQGGFCSPKVMEILADAYQNDLLTVTKSGVGSSMLAGRIKEELQEGAHYGEI